MRDRWVEVAFAAVMGPATGCATTSAMGRTDAGITNAVEQRLEAHPDVRDLPIDVDTDDGVVTLEGFVLDEQTRRAAQTVAAGTPGARRVDNELRLQDPSPGAHPQLDAWITAVVGRKLMTHTPLDPDHVRVETKGQVVTLRGEVPTEFLKDQAKRLAEEVEFVEDVNNQLTIVNEGAGPR